MPPTSEAWLATVARRMGELKDEVVFVGGAVLTLLLDDPGVTPARPTDDVDVIVELPSKARYDAIAERLLRLGFQPDTSEDAPMCRWLIDGLVVDVMPTSSEILGFSNRWYADAIMHAMVRELEPGLSIRVATAPYFIAMKLEAFAGRGEDDFAASHDLEDVIAVVDGHATVVEEIEGSDQALCDYLAETMETLLETELFVTAVPGHLAGDAASQARLTVVLDRLRRISRPQG